jgi:hypothetical protein
MNNNHALMGLILKNWSGSQKKRSGFGIEDDPHVVRTFPASNLTTESQIEE